MMKPTAFNLEVSSRLKETRMGLGLTLDQVGIFLTGQRVDNVAMEHPLYKLQSSLVYDLCDLYGITPEWAFYGVDSSHADHFAVGSNRLDLPGIASRLRMIRKEKGLTQRSLCDSSSVNIQAVGCWERTSWPSHHSLVKIAAGLYVGISELLYPSRQTNPPLMNTIPEMPCSQKVWAVCKEDNRLVRVHTPGKEFHPTTPGGVKGYFLENAECYKYRQ